MSGIQNIKQYMKQYNNAEIYFHQDCDGVFSAIAMKEYLKKYGIKTIKVHSIQYGESEYAIYKPKKDVLPVMVDFAHGKTFIKIHTDHHQNQIKYDTSSNQFRHSKSNAETISSIIANNLFSNMDIKIVNMIDSADFYNENIMKDDLLKAVFKYDDKCEYEKNKKMLGLVANKLILTYKNRKGFLEEIVMKSNCSVISIYNTIQKIIKRKIKSHIKGFIKPCWIEKNAINYLKQQENSKIQNGNFWSIFKMKNGETILLDDCIFQIGGGNMLSIGSYDRYTAFRLYPQAKYLVMFWNKMGLLQISKNPWLEKDDNIIEISLIEIILNKIVNEKYSKQLENHNISLLTMKKIFEKNINLKNERKTIGFNAEEVSKLFNKEFEDKKIKKYMNYKITKFVDEKNDLEDIFNVLGQTHISFKDIVEKLSGGHKDIVNISGFNLLNEQKWVDYKLRKNINPFIVNKKRNKRKTCYTPIGEKILRNIAIDCVKVLRKGC